MPKGIIRGTRASVIPINLFEAIAVGTALAIKTKGSAKRHVLKRLLNDDALKVLTTGGTNSNKMVVGRINYVRDKLV